ncbi:MAG: hypothetical protein WDM87_13695 [Terracidiphilus sp.]
MAVTRRQKEVLDFLEAFVSRNGYSPSFEEIARGMSLKSLATVHKHITNLEKKACWIGCTTAAGRLTCCRRGRGRARA